MPMSMTGPAGRSFSAAASPSLGAVAELRDELRAAIADSGLPEPARNDLLLAMSEIATNVVRHAMPPASEISIELSCRDGAWLLEVLSDGGAFGDFAQRVEALDDDPLDKGLNETGLGLHLVTRLFPNHGYEAADSGRAERHRFWLRHDPSREGAPRIVIVDDDPVLRRLMELYLRDDYRVSTFADATTALAALESEPADLVISDIDMPGIDGMDLRRRLSASKKSDLIPFVFLTSIDDAEVRKRASGLGIDDFLIKPLRKAEVLALVERLLTRARQLREGLGARLDEDITAALAPSLPARLCGFATAVRSRPVATGGGDLVCHLASAAGDTVIVADVMGHGVGAKFFAHAHAGYFNGLARTLPAGAGPAETLARLSALVATDPLLRSTMITCLALNLRPDGVVRIASAGHPRPLLWRPDGLSFVEVGGMLPGLDRDATYGEVEVVLGPRGRLVLYTDGLTECGDATEDYRLEMEILEAVRSSARLPLERAADRIMTVRESFTGGALRDDVTVVLLDAAPIASR